MTFLSGKMKGKAVKVNRCAMYSEGTLMRKDGVRGEG